MRYFLLSANSKNFSIIETVPFVLFSFLIVLIHSFHLIMMDLPTLYLQLKHENNWDFNLCNENPEHIGILYHVFFFILDFVA